MTIGYPRWVLRGLLALCALAPLPLLAQEPDESWMRLDDELIKLAEARCAEIFAGEEYIMQSNGDEFLKLRFEYVPESNGDFDFSKPRHVNVSRTHEDEAYYLLDRSVPPRSQGDRSGATGSALLFPENDAARERHPDGAEIAFSLLCASE